MGRGRAAYGGTGGRAVTGEEGYREGYAALSLGLDIQYPYKTNVA